MLFNSPHFILFFVVVTTLYFLSNVFWRQILLLIASCYFYMCFVPEYILILLGTILIDYIAGIYIAKSNEKYKKWLLALSLIANVGILVYFKYFNFLNESLSGILNIFKISNPINSLSILLPIGLSFHTFQAMSYTIEVYRGNQKPEKNFIVYALYVMYYPQLVAGPIERPQNILHQFNINHSFDYNRITSGLRLMAWGLFKKVVIADRLSIMVDNIYNDVHSHKGVPLILSTIFFAFQIYCDFSGYSDIAIGASRVMGIKLMDNFNRPYASKSVQEFWTRWHISLSTWFRDYVYIPLGGSRNGQINTYMNLFLVFLISGLWHGANWTYVVWGGVLAFFIIISNILKPLLNKLIVQKNIAINSISIIITFILIDFAWIFFRAKNLSDANYIIGYIFSGLKGQIIDIYHNTNNCKQALLYLGIGESQFYIALISIVIMEVIQFICRNKRIEDSLINKPIIIRWGVYILFVCSIFLFGIFDHKQPFIYFQF